MSKFLTQYESYFAHRTDAPSEFGHAGGLMCLSTIALGRRWLSTGIHPNIYFLIVGPSSRDRKSTSINIAMKLIEAIVPDRVGPSDFTPEGLLFRMRKKVGKKTGRNKMVIALSEFGQHLSVSRRTYGAGLGALMCQLYDGDTIERARSGHKTLIVVNPRLNMFGGCAYGMLEKYCDPVDWEGGFFARMCFIRAGERRQAFASIPVPRQAMEDACRASLKDLSDELKNTPGPMSISPPALTLYESAVASIADTSGDVAVVAQRERLLNAIPRFALLYQIDDAPNLPIQPQAMQRAIDFAMLAWQTFESTYSRCAGTAKARFYRKVWKAISDAGDRGLSRRDLLREFSLNIDELMATTKVLIDSGVLKPAMLEGGTTNGGPKERPGYRIIEPYPTN